MAEYRDVQVVRPGITTEYYSVIGQDVSITTNDRLIMSFDKEVTVDELMVYKVGGGGSFNWDLNIVYPQTGIRNFIYNSTGDYTMNGGDNVPAVPTAPNVKTWFRLPANSSLELTFFAVASSATVELIVIGR